uniref:Uncharacterized protein n=1 Tax=viral metagenome TaxID=1070528 RepID=A0A6M3K0G1_9ZZZZ
MEFRFTHRMLNFNPVGILLALGITPKTYPFRYQALVSETFYVIETQVEVTAQKLNFLIKEAYRKDMFDIEEYIRFPGYVSVMEQALNNPAHIGVYWDDKNVVQARFINTEKLGDIGDLQAIQQLVYPLRGTLDRWRGLYIAWLEGRSNRYAETVGRRLDLMRTFGIAPFWELIEYGNQQYPAYPTNGPKRTLSNFKGIYNREMTVAYQRVLGAVRQLIGAPDLLFRDFDSAMVMYLDQPQFGYTWTSRMGKNVFALAGTERLVGNRLVARGFILNPAGLVVKKWSGWLPR